VSIYYLATKGKLVFESLVYRVLGSWAITFVCGTLMKYGRDRFLDRYLKRFDLPENTVVFVAYFLCNLSAFFNPQITLVTFKKNPRGQSSNLSITDM
jgi:hypothetical protein